MLRSLSRYGFRFALAFVSTAVVFGGEVRANVDPPDSRVPPGKYELPEFSNKQMPSISSCDPKNPLGDKNLMTGNGFLDSAVSGFQTVKDAFEKKEDEGDAEDEADVDGKATISTDCEKLYGGERSRTNYDAEKMQCGQFKNNANLLEEIEAAIANENKYLACQRGVIGALGGELVCFRKQITDAEKYMSELVNGKGGLAEMLTQGNARLEEIGKEVQDREAQLKNVAQRLEGGPGGNPPSLLKAKETVTKMMADLTVQANSVKTQADNLRSQQQRFETLVKQATMARAMECMAQPTAEYSCVKPGASSANYPAGGVSPIDYIKCIYAQSANKLVGGKRVINAKKEQAMKSEAEAIFKQIAGFHSPNANLPEYNDKDGFAKSMKIYKANTPDELLALVNGTFNAMQGRGGDQNFYNQFARDLRRCYFRSSGKSLANDNSAQAQIERERQDANSPIRASQEAMKQAFSKAQTDLGANFRSLHSTYREALRALTGDSKTAGTVDACANGSLEAQVSCMDAFASMAGSLVTGKVQQPKAALGKEALALTGGMPPAHQFTSVLMAKNNPQRSIAVNCFGLDDCVGQYTNLRTSLEEAVGERKSYQASFKKQVNTQIQNAARNLAGTDAGTSMTLNKLATAIQGRKNDLLSAFSRLKVEGGIDLDPRETKDVDFNKEELFSPAELASVVLGLVSPSLPDANSKGFSDALSAVRKRDDELEKKQDELDRVLAQAESKKAECAKDEKKVACDKLEKSWDKCREDAKDDPIAKVVESLTGALATASATGKADDAAKIRDQLMTLGKAPGKGQDNSGSTPDTVALTCGAEKDAYEKACQYGDAVTDALSKDDQTVGGKRNGGALRTRSGS